MRSLAILLVAASIASAQGFRAGAAAVVISPPAGTPMAGYYSTRLSTGVHDDLHAKAIVMEAGGQRVALVACDLVGIPPSVIEEAGLDDDCIAADTRDETPNDFWERSNVALFSGVEVREWDGAVDLAGCRLALSRHDLTRELAADELGREAATGTALYRLP